MLSRLPFKRHFIILATCLMLIGIAVPVATFAASPKSEPHHAPIKAKVTQKIDPATSLMTTTATTDELCGSSSTTVVSNVKQGNTVNGTAMIAPTDPTDTGEASEGETLVLLEQNSQFTKPIKTIAIPDGTVSFQFTAGANNDTLTACVNGADMDELGTIIATVTPAPSPSPIDKLCTSFGGLVKSLCNNTAKTIGTIQNNACVMPNSAACKALEMRVGKAFCSIGADPASCTPEIEEEVGHILIGEARCDLGLDLLKKVPAVGAILHGSLEAISPLVCPIIGAIKDVSE